MPDVPASQRDDSLSPQARARRDEMLPSLLAEVRRVRRRRTLTKGLTGAALLALCSGVLFLATLAPGRSAPPLTLAARSGPGHPSSITPAVPQTKVQLVQSSPDILERLAIRSEQPARIEYIDTDQALGILESGGERYGFIEIAGRTEFLLIASN